MGVSLGPLPGPLRSYARAWVREDPWSDDPSRTGPQAFILFNGISELYLLAVDGEVYLYDGADDSLKRIEDGPEKVYCIALGSRRRRELAYWLPTRPSHAADCVECKGTTWNPRYDSVCVACAGLGWIPAPDGPAKELAKGSS